VFRLVNGPFALQIGWFLPVAVLATVVVAVLVVTTSTRAGVSNTTIRYRAARAGWLMWGLWLVVGVAVFSLMTGAPTPTTACWSLRQRQPW
jgi:hypothetical protein